MVVYCTVGLIAWDTVHLVVVNLALEYTEKNLLD